jgi:outer membrane lipoprotein-sorting protein
MRLVSMLAFALASTFLISDDEAQQLCLGMEKRIMDAKTLHIAFAMTVEVDDQRGELRGNLWLGDGNKTRIEINGTVPGGKTLEMKMVCDGDKMVTQTSGQPSRPPRDPPKTVGEITRGTIARAGIFAGIFYSVPDKEEPKLDDLFQLTDFKMGNRQKIGAMEKLAFEYKIAFRGAKERGLITVWMETPSMLPSKRIFTINDTTHKVRIMESYGEFQVDSKLDLKTFDLPD